MPCSVSARLGRVVAGIVVTLAGGPLAGGIPDRGPGPVVIHEVHYDPPDKTVFEEFVELYNLSDRPVDLSGWFFSDGIAWTFPEGTVIEPEGFAVVAEDPETLAETLGVTGAYGPWEGRLANEGEPIVLRNAAGGIEDRVEFGRAFPWPLAPAGGGSSMELIHPALDNALGGHWRASGLIDAPPRERMHLLERGADGWHWRRGDSEASDPPSAWREPGFVEDASWSVGRTPVGYGDDDDRTVLDDMEDSYSSVYLRREFTVDAEPPVHLMLGLYADDGAVVWINDVEVLRSGVVPGELAHDDRARRGREAEWEESFLPNPAAYLREGRNVIAVHAFNVRSSSSDFSIDAALFTPGEDDFDDEFLAFPTPGGPNTVRAENAPPYVRRVQHDPQQPPPGEPVVITAEVGDPQGVASAVLRYQVVPPGEYIPAFLPLPPATLLSNPTQDRPPNPVFEDPAMWEELSLRDDGKEGDAVPGDGVYTAVLPSFANRTLLRYRIEATDTRGKSVVIPYADDPSLNFAAWIYAGVPPYETTLRSVHPEGAGHVYPREVMRALPVYFLITRAQDYTQCIGYSSTFQIPKSNEAARDKFNWEAAFVYEGIVYDHMRYRLRQANDRYGARGKRSMRFRFHRGNWLRAKDNFGKLYPQRWRTVNTGKMFDNKRVGNFGLTERLNNELWNLAGAPAPWVHTFHLRVVKTPEEAPEGDAGQYLGDFQGMFLAFEDYDPRYLDTHGLEEGNLYKLKDGIFNGRELKRNQGRNSVTDDSDFQNIRRNLRPDKPDEWLRAHVHWDRWYRYHAVVEAVRHYDFRPSDTHSKNRAWYFEPTPDNEFGRVWLMPHDSDASWGPNWNSGVDYPKNAIFSGRGREPFKMEYRNFMREFRDLVWTREVIERWIDDLALRIEEFSRADRDRWRGAPAQAGRQDFGPLGRKVEDMKRFAFVGWSGSTGPTVPAGGRAAHLDRLAAAEGEADRIPDTPAVEYAGREGAPVDRLSFQAGAYSDPQDDPPASTEWRLAEVSPPDAPWDPDARRPLEWNALWEEELEGWVPGAEVPATVAAPGRTYRVRVRVKDATGRWSHWSEPAEFVGGEALAPSAAESRLRITELMYNPPGDEGFEFVELANTGAAPLDLAGVAFVEGILFRFPDDAVLDPGERLVVVRNRAAFAKRYPDDAIRIAGEYDGRLSNEGEVLRLVHGEAFVVHEFIWDPGWHPTTDGGGFSLVPVDPASGRGERERPDAWRPSRELFGSPGAPDGAVEAGWVMPGDVDLDGGITINDPVLLLGLVFGGAGRRWPCGEGPDGPGTLAVLDADASGGSDLTDAIRMLQWLFASGPPHAAGVECVPLEGCPDVCTP